MPIDYKKYPSNWKTEIRPLVLLRADNCCEFCGVRNYSVGHRDKDGSFNKTCGNQHHDKAGNGELPYKEAVELMRHCKYSCDDYNLIVIVLTIAHLDHNIENNDYSNLKALCQKCHLDYDKEHHIRNSRNTRNAKMGLTELKFNQ
jgi:hypothetical protein